MTDQQTPGELWPPASGLPSRDRMKPAESLRWGETPFDDLTRAELLRLVQGITWLWSAPTARCGKSAIKIPHARSG
jgi:hypothetical protein